MIYEMQSNTCKVDRHEEHVMNPPEGKKFYGSVTVSERGQIVIPVDARRDFNIKAGDKLLVFGDLEQGVAFTTSEIMSRTMTGALDLFRQIGTTMGPDGDTDAPDIAGVPS